MQAVVYFWWKGWGGWGVVGRGGRGVAGSFSKTVPFCDMMLTVLKEKKYFLNKKDMCT